MLPSPEHLAHNVHVTLDLPISRASELTLVEHTEGFARCRMRVTEAVSAHSHQLNGGELYGLLDFVSYLALATLLADDLAAVSHDVHFSILSAAPRGREAEIRARVEKRGRSVAFMRCEAALLGEGNETEERTIALGTVTKSIIPLAMRLRHRDAPPT